MKNHDCFTAQELEIHIKRCEILMHDASARYSLSGCFSDRGEVDGWRVAMERAIAERAVVVEVA